MMPFFPLLKKRDPDEASSHREALEPVHREQREQDLMTRSDDLEERILSFSRKEDEIAIVMLHLAEREKEGLLKQLDEYFTCSL